MPDAGDVPLVADMSSTLLSRPIDVSKFGVIYAGAQKNIGPAGVTVVIVRDDLLGRARADAPGVLDYAAVAKEHSMLNTPPTYAWYLAGLVFQWLKRQGGLSAMGDRNRAKAEKLYAAIDNSPFYANPVERDARSWMNVPFTLANPALDKSFLALAKSPASRRSRVTGRWVACAPASTTRCRWPASTRWSTSWAPSSARTHDDLQGTDTQQHLGARTEPVSA